MKASVYLSALMPALGIFAMLAMSACSENSGTNGNQPVADTEEVEFTVYVLSRGKGVPEPTRVVFENASSFLGEAKQRGEVLSLNETRIGLEGETRLCVEAKDAASARALQDELWSIAGDAELFDVVEEPCSEK